MTYAESKPALARKTPQLVERVLTLTTAMIESVAESEEWDQNIGDDEDADEVEDSVHFGEEALERFMIAMGGNRMVPATLPLLAQKLASPAWQQRYAALRSLALLASSADKALAKSLIEVVNMAASFLVWAPCSSSSPRLMLLSARAFSSSSLVTRGALTERKCSGQGDGVVRIVWAATGKTIPSSLVRDVAALLTQNVCVGQVRSLLSARASALPSRRTTTSRFFLLS